MKSTLVRAEAVEARRANDHMQKNEADHIPFDADVQSHRHLWPSTPHEHCRRDHSISRFTPSSQTSCVSCTSLTNASPPSTGFAYLTLSTATQLSFPPSKLHPTGPKSHSAQISHFTLPLAVSIPGEEGGMEVVASGRE